MSAAISPVEREDEDIALFFAQSLDLLCVASFDGYFKRLNPAWTERLGWSLEELLDSPFLDFVHPDDREATQMEFTALRRGRATTRFENRYRHRDGSYRWLRWNARPVPRAQRIYASARDVTRQKKLERAILEIADREKERFGREMHDGLCQTLTGIAALSSTLARSLVDNSRPEWAATAAEIAVLLHGAINEAREMAHNLGPLDLGDSALDTALESLTLNVRRQFGVRVSFDCDRPFEPLNREVKAHLFRIVQEAVSNGVTHGRAEQIRVTLSRRGNTGLLCIEDDGVGIRNEYRDNGDFGVQAMVYRARSIGGSLEIRRRSKGGTRVSCEFPASEACDVR